MILFPDTHFFLHFRDAAELPWSEILPDEEVHLVVCRTIQREIDRKEHELRGRPQRRARKFASQIGDIGVSGAPLVLREKRPRVTLDYRRRPAGWQPPAGLSEGWGDDMMVADALAFMETTGEVVAVLTNDIGVYQTARDHNVKAFYLRGKQHWHLPDVLDDRDKELAKLKAENSDLRTNSPVICLETEVDDNMVPDIGIKVIRFAPLNAEQIGRLMVELLRRHPLATDFSKPKAGLLGLDVPELPSWINPYEDQAPTENEIRIYTQETYPNWLQRVGAYLKSFSQHLEAAVPETLVIFLLCNRGTVPAENVILRFEALGGFQLAEQPENDDESEEDDLSSTNAADFPTPPIAPSWKRVEKRNLYDRLASMHQPLSPIFGGRASEILPSMSSIFERMPARKPQDFYREELPGHPSNVWSFTCEDFRHKAKPEGFAAKLLVVRDKLPVGHVGVRVTLSARNMRAPFETTVPVRVLVSDGDTEAEALKLMPSKYSYILRSKT